MIVTLMMIIMTVEMNYLEDTMILDDRQQYQMITMKKNYFADTTISKHSLTAKKNYFIDAMTLEHPFFLRHTVLTTFVTKEIRHRKRIR